MASGESKDMHSLRRKFNEIKTRKGLFRGILFITGYILSPLTWWNDLFVNIPISYVIASIISKIIGEDYFPELIVSVYLFTNVLGFLLMHISISWGRTSRRKLLIDIIIATGYTILVYVLALLGYIKPI